MKFNGFDFYIMLLRNGSDGYDTILYSGVRSAYSIVKNGDVMSVSAKSGLEGIDTLRNIEKIPVCRPACIE